MEGGIYISSEFQMGQVYMGETDDNDMDEIILYRPVYACVPHQRMCVTNTEKSSKENLELCGKESNENSIRDSRQNLKVSPSEIKEPPDIVMRDSDDGPLTRSDSEGMSLTRRDSVPSQGRTSADISKKHSPAYEEMELEEISAEENVNTELDGSSSLSTHSLQSKRHVTQISTSGLDMQSKEDHET